ncbi:MAG: SdiA-regulated domain-containing protein [Rhodothermales bacterium]
MTHYLSVLIALGLLVLARPSDPPARAFASYDLDHPDAVYELPGVLREISGLTVLDDTHLGAVQDEKGRLFVINVETGEVVRETRFGKDGDYEGIELTPDGLFILESNGTLWRIDDWQRDDPDAEKIKTDLSSRYDTEGLAFDAVHNRLLIACKEYPGRGLKGRKTIYAYDLTQQKLIEEPAFIITPDAVTHLDRHPLNRALRGALTPLVDASGFKPSALAINPTNGLMYVVSSVLKSIVVLEPDGSVRAAVAIPESSFNQPEGIAFMPDGTLYLSNEGGAGPATLLRFRPR